MKRLTAILIGLALAIAAAGAARADDGSRRSGYSYVRDTAGEVTVNSRYNGRVEARRNLPISAGDELVVSNDGRADVALADGNELLVGPGARVRFTSLRDQQGEEDQFSAINLIEGSVVLAAFGDNQNQIPRIDTEDATVYLSAGDRVRVNADSRRGTVVVGRAGTIEVRTRAGTFRVKAGEFLEARGDEEPQVERGVFSRDRFDIWAADRIDSVTVTETRSARYVDNQYASDVVALDGYGDWQYSDEYGADVWSPRVAAGWSPYSSGSWYYTPAGMTWWSYDPWGWYPHHYGSWFFSAGWNRWCWQPFSVYSPGWVYWGYTPSYVGWCPIGFYSPWYDGYYRHQGWFDRGNVFISINGVFSARTVDFRGWNFAGSNNFGAAVARMDVIPGSRIAERLGAATVAVSSRPMVVNARPGQAREAVQSFVREAPRVVARTASADSAQLAPILARQRTLPAATIEAARQRAVVAERGRLAGPGVADIAPRGALVDRNRTLTELSREPATRTDGGRTAPGAPIAPRDARDTRALSERGRPAPPAGMAPERVSPHDRAAGRPESDWRSRSAPQSIDRPQGRAIERPQSSERPEGRSFERSESRPVERARPERSESQPPSDWRSRPRSAAPVPAPEAVPRSETARSEGWRSRSEVPPARRVIEGAVPGRRAPEAAPGEAPRQRSWRSPDREMAPPVREARPEPRPDYRPPRELRPESAPPPRAERPPVYSAPPPPRAERPQSYSPPPPPPPQRSEGHRSAPPPPPPDRSRRDH